MDEIRRPKIIWKDISDGPSFWVDRSGSLVPRHSVYYLVPKDPKQLDPIARYLASKEAARWIEAHCQRAANGYLRLQSNVLRAMPVPSSLASGG
jgi:adenine-specific DNA-methyltransferase